MSTLEIEVSLIIPARNSSHSLESTVCEAYEYLKKRYADAFEIILVPNPAPEDLSEGLPEELKDQSTAIAEGLARRFSAVRVCPHSLPQGKGAAIRTGFQASRGRWIFFTDSDLPYDLDFFDKAMLKLRSGYDFVTGNRRLASSIFHVPVSLLPLAYGRHRLGLAFNRVVRWILPISTTDTQAGIKALSRRLATEAFARQECPGFLFDLEIFLTAHANGFKHTDLPVTLHLNTEKSTVRVLRECLMVAYWLTRISWRNSQRAYGPRNKAPRERILSRYREASPGTKLFLMARWKLTPYQRMVSYLPKDGKILDLGCGHGLLSLAAALRDPSREILGIDHDSNRIGLASSALKDLPNIRITTGNMVSDSNSEESFSGIAMIDVLHYFDPAHQELLLQNAHRLLQSGGTLLVREVDPHGGMISKWNRWYEKLATKTGFTQAEPTDKGLHFRSRPGWEDLMRTAGFKVSSERCSSFIFADILYICERP